MNAYFQLIGDGGKTSLRLVPPTNGGRELQTADVIDYLVFHKIAFDLSVVNKEVLELFEEKTIQLNDNELIPVNEEVVISIADDNMSVTGVFSCASDKGSSITKDEIIQDLKYKGIKFGIDEESIDKYLANREYNEPIVLAKGQSLIRGKDAYIEFFFNTDIKARPTLNDDGSVDFYNLNIINHVDSGDLLARLHREDPGKPGTDVLGKMVMPPKVQRKVLKFGRNIRINDDRTEIYSMCNGHVTYVGDTVFVSDVMEVENVDNSTGNIEYEGNVQVNGNVCSNFSIKAKGNVEVRGVVEGALVEAGGNITIALGMNGMGKGVLKSGGNVIAKFIENSTVEAEGYVECGSIMHSDVVAGTEVNVNGRKAFISGGKVTATSKIETKILGSDMGADTVVEIGVSAILKKQYKEMGDQIEEIDKALSRAIPIMEAAKDKLEAGIALNEEQLENLKNIYKLSQIKKEERNNISSERDKIGIILMEDKNAAVIVNDIAYSGTKIIISDSSKIIKESVEHCKFVRKRGDVTMVGL